MIKKKYLFPEYYIHKVPYCDECNIPLKDTGQQLLVNPPISMHICPRCGKEYTFNVNELQGEWKWRTL